MNKHPNAPEHPKQREEDVTPRDMLREAVARQMADRDGKNGFKWNWATMSVEARDMWLSLADAALSAIEQTGWRVVSENDLDEMRAEWRGAGWGAGVESTRE